jgi:hypothetical protein
MELAASKRKLNPIFEVHEKTDRYITSQFEPRQTPPDEKNYPAQVITPPTSQSIKLRPLLPVIERITGGATKIPEPIIRLRVKALEHNHNG